MHASKIGIGISIGTLVVTLLAAVPAYIVFFDKADLVYETQIENIPLPKDLTGELPDTLAIVTVENIGQQPSTDLQGNVTIPGKLVEYQVQGPNPAYGEVSKSLEGQQIVFRCARLVPGDYVIRLSAWYRGAATGPDVGVSDAHGAAREVGSIEAEKGKYRPVGAGFLGVLVGLAGTFVSAAGALKWFEVKVSIARAAGQITAERPQTNAGIDEQACGPRN